MLGQSTLGCSAQFLLSLQHPEMFFRVVCEHFPVVLSSVVLLKMSEDTALPISFTVCSFVFWSFVCINTFWPSGAVCLHNQVTSSRSSLLICSTLLTSHEITSCQILGGDQQTTIQNSHQLNGHGDPKLQHVVFLLITVRGQTYLLEGNQCHIYSSLTIFMYSSHFAFLVTLLFLKPSSLNMIVLVH